MKLLLDENLSDRIIPQIADLYPDSMHVKTEGLLRSDDAAIWTFAKSGNYILLSKDWDFHQLSLLHGFPPKVIYLDIGNSSTQDVIHLLRSEFQAIQSFCIDPQESLLILDKS